MKIYTPLNDMKDELISFISEGFGILGEAFSNPYNSHVPAMRQDWEVRVVNYLDRVFPTKKESGQFLHTPGLELIFNKDSNIHYAMNRTNINLIHCNTKSR